MSRMAWRAGAIALVLAAALAVAGAAQEVTFSDPQGDDDGPGKYTYPTDPIFLRGSFDLTGFRLKAKGDRVEVEVKVAAKLQDVWNTGAGFSLQTVFIFVQTEDRRPLKPATTLPKDGKNAREGAAGSGGAGTAGAAGAPAAPGAAGIAGSAGTAGPGATEPAAGAPGESATAAGAQGTQPGASAPKIASAAGAPAGGKSAAKPPTKVSPGITRGFPGLGVQFGPEDAWDRCIILAPEPAARLRSDIEAVVPAAMRPAIIVPNLVRGAGSTISASFDRKLLGQGDPRSWGFQVVMAGYDPYPPLGGLLILKVNETESQYRFGGGTDGDCDPNVLDVLDSEGEREGASAAEQHAMLQYECNPDNSPKKLATLRMVRIPKEETAKERREKAREKRKLEEEQERLKREGQTAPPAPGTLAVPPPAAPPATPPPASPAVPQMEPVDAGLPAPTGAR